MIAGSLIAISVLCGVATAWVFRNTTNLAALRGERRRLFAHLMEFRLFSDEPGLIWRAQLLVIGDNLRLLRLLLLPLALVSIPMALLLVKLDSVYGTRGLESGETAVITGRFNHPLTAKDEGALEVPAGVIVDAPPVRIPMDQEISWRIRALDSGEKNLHFMLERRALKLEYPRVDVRILGLGLPWIAWFVLFSSAAALCAITLRW